MTPAQHRTSMSAHAKLHYCHITPKQHSKRHTRAHEAQILQAQNTSTNMRTIQGSKGSLAQRALAPTTHDMSKCDRLVSWMPTWPPLQIVCEHTCSNVQPHVHGFTMSGSCKQAAVSARRNGALVYSGRSFFLCNCSLRARELQTHAPNHACTTTPKQRHRQSSQACMRTCCRPAVPPASP